MAKLDECQLDNLGAVTYPFVFDRPEESWQAAFDQRHRSRVDIQVLNCAANFFSIGSEPKFLNDPDKVLFGYLKAVVTGIRESFEKQQSW